MKKINDFVLNCLEDLKAENIVNINVKKITGLTDNMVIATGTSTTHTRALANHLIVEAKKNNIEVLGHEGENTAEWILIDFAYTIVHIMLPKTREYYDIEKLWR